MTVAAAPAGDAQPAELVAALAAIMVVSGAGFMGTAPFIADYIVMAIAVVGLVLLAMRRDWALLSPTVMMLALGVVLVAITLPFVYRSELDLLPVLAFLPVLLAPGVAAMIGKSRLWLAPQAFALVCLVGTAAAVMAGLAEYSATGARVGVGNNPIHYGGIAVLLGFMALMGVAKGRSIWRMAFMAGPLLGLIAAILSQSRGPMLAWVVMAAVAAPVLVRWYWRDAGFMIVAALAVVATAIVGVVLGAGGRAASAIDAVKAVLGLGELDIASVDAARTALYSASWEAFASAPIFGLGYGQMMPFAVERYPIIGDLENLHGDIANFAAMSGIFGLVSYALILLAPLALLWRARGVESRPLVLGVVSLVVGFAALGATNAMFGLLPQTVLFTLWLGYLMAYRRTLTAA